MFYVSFLFPAQIEFIHLSMTFLKIHGYTCSDGVFVRTLGNGVNIPTGTTAESCVAACQAAGGFTHAGLENGHECCE